MIRETKGIGIGAGQFADASSLGLTAHNAYVLAAAEAGIVGMFLFGLALYLSLKVPLVVWFGKYDVDPDVARFAPALAVALCGAAADIFFLSWSYKDILYMLCGASAALYAVARAQDPRVSVTLSLREGAVVCGALLGLLGVVWVGVRLRG